MSGAISDRRCPDLRRLLGHPRLERHQGGQPGNDPPAAGSRRRTTVARSEGTLMTKVGFIGLGNMGIGMARNIAAKGWPLSVWNRSSDKAEALAGANVTAVRTP